MMSEPRSSVLMLAMHGGPTDSILSSLQSAALCHSFTY